MEDNTRLLESLLEKATDYGKASIELIKLQALDKIADTISSLVPISVVILLIASFFLFANLGVAFWLGGIFGKIFYGFFAVAVFYILAAIVIHFFFKKWIKRQVGNYFIKHILK